MCSLLPIDELLLTEHKVETGTIGTKPCFYTIWNLLGVSNMKSWNTRIQRGIIGRRNRSTSLRRERGQPKGMYGTNAL
jgi:hypothetical protein